MPRTTKPKAGWRAGALVPDIQLSKPQGAALCEAAGLDAMDASHQQQIKRMLRGVAEAVGLYRAEHDSDQDAPRPVHQRVALEAVQDHIDGLIEAFNTLDDASMERLSARRQFDKANPKFHDGMKPSQALEHLRDWSGAVTLALRDLDGAESRGRATDSARILLLTLLRDVFVDAADDGDLAEFITVGCNVAGVHLSTRQAQAQAKQLLPENTP